MELFGASGLQALSRDALLHGLLQSTPITDVGFERLLTNIRAAMLTAEQLAQLEALHEEYRLP